MILFLKGCLSILNKELIINEQAQKIINLLMENGATIYVVGGSIRNYYLNYPINDLDLEVYHIDFTIVKELFNDEDTYINEKFQTIKIKNIEIALPRVELKVGLNYNDYQLFFSRDIKPSEAIQRRDFTINSLMYNINETKLEDYCLGEVDLANHLLKATNFDKFCEDSIRVLRLLNYQSSLNLKIEQKTFQLAQKMSIELWYQPKPLVQKLFKQIIANQYFDVYLFFDILGPFFNVKELKNRISNSVYHPEKSLYNHILGSLLCLDLCYSIEQRDYYILFWTLFFHDFGKLDECRNHELASIVHFEKYEELIVAKEKDRQLIKMLISDHMCIREYAQNGNEIEMEALRRKYHNRFYLLELVGLCDYGGRVLDFNVENFEQRLHWYREEVLSKYRRSSGG